MKYAKKLASLLLALVMMLALGATAFAVESDGSIIITNATVGKRYSVYKVFDLTYSTNEDDTTNVAYTYTKRDANDAFLAALQDSSSPFTLVETPMQGKYSVTLKNDKSAEDISTFLSNQKANLTVADEKTATDSTLTFEKLEYGYYFVTSEVGAVITIDSTLPNVKIVDKNQKPDWDNGEEKPGKVIIDANGNKVTENTVNYGDTVNFSIAVDATAYVGDKQVTYYYITDTLADGFNKAKNIVAAIGGKTLDETDYTLTQNGNTFMITIPYKETYGANAKMEVTYSATVNNNAVLAGDGNRNTANFTYDTKEPGTDTPAPDADPKFPEENKKTTTTYVYALGIVKVDPEGNPLKGAEFSVTDANNTTIFAKATDTKGVYEYCTKDIEGAVEQFATDGNGVLVIKGVKADSYKVTEQVAPKGYNLLSEPVDVEAKLKEEYTETIITYLDKNGKVTGSTTDNKKATNAGVNVAGLVVVNNRGAELPSTGGMGTTIFYVVGGLLVVSAVVLLVVKKRMSRSEQ